MAKQHGGWQTFGEKTVYDNRWVRLSLVDVEAPNGERWEYHVVHLDRIAVALIVDDQDRVLMLGLLLDAWRRSVGGYGRNCGGFGNRPASRPAADLSAAANHAA